MKNAIRILQGIARQYPAVFRAFELDAALADLTAKAALPPGNVLPPGVSPEAADEAKRRWLAEHPEMGAFFDARPLRLVDVLGDEAIVEEAWCPGCGKPHEIVRPGKTQPTCSCDDEPITDNYGSDGSGGW